MSESNKQVRFFKVNAVPSSWEPDSVYFVRQGGGMLVYVTSTTTPAYPILVDSGLMTQADVDAARQVMQDTQTLRGQVETALTDVAQSRERLEQVTHQANIAKDAANTAAGSANTAAQGANSARDAANDAARAANTAAQTAQDQASNAQYWAGQAQQATTAATTAAKNANNAVSDVNTAKTAANTAAESASAATSEANAARDAANTAAENATTQANHARTQGDYARQQGDYAKQQGDLAKDAIAGTYSARAGDADRFGGQTPAERFGSRKVKELSLLGGDGQWTRIARIQQVNPVNGEERALFTGQLFAASDIGYTATKNSLALFAFCVREGFGTAVGKPTFFQFGDGAAAGFYKFAIFRDPDGWHYLWLYRAPWSSIYSFEYVNDACIEYWDTPGDPTADSNLTLVWDSTTGATQDAYVGTQRVWHSGNFDPNTKANTDHNHDSSYLRGDGDRFTANAYLSDKALYLRGSGDHAHSLRYAGPGREFAGLAPDGPALYGRDGGVLGTNNDKGMNWSLQWDANGNINTRGTLQQNGVNVALTTDPRLRDWGHFAAYGRDLTVYGKRALVGFNTDDGNSLVVNFAGDFGGGVHVHGPKLAVYNSLSVGGAAHLNGGAFVNGHAVYHAGNLPPPQAAPGIGMGRLMGNSQSTSPGVWTTLRFAVDLGSVGMTVTDTRWTVNTAGKYLLTGSVEYGNGFYTWQISVRINGNNVAHYPSASTTTRPLANILTLNAGDYVELWGYGDDETQKFNANSAIALVRIGS